MLAGSGQMVSATPSSPIRRTIGAGAAPRHAVQSVSATPSSPIRRTIGAGAAPRHPAQSVSATPSSPIRRASAFASIFFGVFASLSSLANVLDFFDREVYGEPIPAPARLSFVCDERGEAFGGLAERRQYRILSSDEKGTHELRVLVYLPAKAERAAPAFVYPNFSGNHTLSDDPAVIVDSGNVYGDERRARGSRADRMPVRRILARGFAVATYAYASLYPDHAGKPRDGSAESVYSIYSKEKLRGVPLAHPAWSWGAVRVRDLLETLPEIDPSRVALVGQSRMALNAIITGAHDSRFALVCANCGGTKSLKHLPNLLFPYWFAPGLRRYAQNARTGLPTRELAAAAVSLPDPPFDSSDLLGLLAPRALFVGAASGDKWSPAADSLACVRKALPHFERYGKSIGFYAKEGPHSIDAGDWERFMDYALGTLGWQSAYSPAVPRENPADQLRFFWQADERIEKSLLAFGFNTLVDGKTYADMSAFDRGDLDFVKQMGSLVSSPALMKKYPRINRDGSKWERTVDASDPAYRAEVHRSFEACARNLAKLKCRVGVQPASELRIRTRPSHTARNAAAFKRDTGLDIPPEADGRAAPHWSKLSDIPADRAIDENHPVLAYYRWFWEKGDGFGPVLADAEETVRARLGYVPFSFMDPAIRVPPLWCACPTLSHISQWQVVNPDPYQHSYIISELKAMARGNPGQRVMMMVQGIFTRWAACARLQTGVDGRTLPEAPAWLKDRPFSDYITPPPDMFRESLWATLSRQIDGVGFHGWNSLFDGVPLGDARTTKSYVFTNDRTTNAIDVVFNRVAKPLGPLLKAADERAPQVAVLESYTSALLSGKAPWDWKIAGFHCGVAATAANLAPYTLYEEEIARFGIPLSVKVILAPQCEIVTKGTAAALRAFRARGGRILADASHAPCIEADGDLPSEPEALAKAVRPYVVPYVTTDKATLLANVRCAGAGADLLFVLNDRRTFGDYVGQWGLIREKGLPERGCVRLRRKAAAVYDLEAHEPVPFRLVDGQTEIPVSFESTGGKVFLVADRPLAALTARDEKGRLVVETSDRDVLVPAEVVTAAGRKVYGLVREGVWRTGVAAKGARVGNLLSENH